MRIKDLILYTADVDSLYSFYHMLFGQKVRQSSDELRIALPQSSLRFLTASPNMEAPYYHFAFNIAENKIQESLTWLMSLDIDPIDGPDGTTIIDFRSWNAHSIYFQDPAGNIVEFIARHDLENAAQGSFHPDMIESVSEIGIPVSDVRRAYEAAHEALGVERYSGDFNAFCPTGTPHGLLIITRLERDWFPTDKRSLPFPFQARISHRRADKHMRFNGRTLHFDDAERHGG